MIEAEVGERRGRPAAENVQNIAQLNGQKTRDVAAEKAGFGNRETYSQAKKVDASGAPELVAAMDEGKVSVSAAAEVATLPKESQTNRATRARIVCSADFERS
ncbi:MAG: hypothetical protein B7Y80_13665 [Hyphomicrobium sp. 32-62-53]|nr:MAG: hypothetical protein B7Z29_12560 [Hyphomicrobium sp. 12-62-95]OYX99073.1 MAG: hypothetical protein B7Y80_13665 [Hyphomicrobium sp. 32-62-53]